MEWVETVAKTVDAAKSAALDQLGVAEDEAEIEVVATPKQGLFGRLRGEARVRARVRPTSVRPKVERRRRPGKNRSEDGDSGADRRERSGKKKPGAADPNVRSAGASEGASDAESGRASGRGRGGRGGGQQAGQQAGQQGGTDAGARNGARNGDKNSGNDRDRGVDTRAVTSSGEETDHTDGPGSRSSSRSSQQRRKESTMSGQETSRDGRNEGPSPVTPDEVAAAAVTFLEGLAGAFGTSASGAAVVEGTEIDVQLSGDDLGLLVGPAGGTLQAVQDLTRVVAQRKLGDHETRLRVDIAQYRERRRAALEKFAHAVSDQVIESQRPRALEPMSSSDRKIIHDVVQTIDGVDSTSDGSEPNRRVVITPAE